MWLTEHTQSKLVDLYIRYRKTSNTVPTNNKFVQATGKNSSDTQLITHQQCAASFAAAAEKNTRSVRRLTHLIVDKGTVNQNSTITTITNNETDDRHDDRGMFVCCILKLLQVAEHLFWYTRQRQHVDRAGHSELTRIDGAGTIWANEWNLCRYAQINVQPIWKSVANVPAAETIARHTKWPQLLTTCPNITHTVFTQSIKSNLNSSDEWSHCWAHGNNQTQIHNTNLQFSNRLLSILCPSQSKA